ncbi:MAG: hypothetical protein ABIQ64_03590 [Candidatus Saccharimonadales bacterium]
MNAFKNLIVGTAVLTVGAFVALPVNVSAAANNGTLKVHEQGTPAATESNDPKVCNFNFEGFGFDKGQSGSIVITTQGGGNDKTEVKQINLPAANANGYTESTYLTLANGHYKTTLYGKSTNGSADYNNELKAKSKVIKVDCPVVVTPPVTVVTPVTPRNPGTTTPTPGVAGTTTESGRVLAESATTTKGAGAQLPESIAATGANPLQILFNTLFAGLGVYSSMLLRKNK